ncbi:MAG: hypothetical protein R2932_33755 [Caldilineaceae bacterium]
MRNRYEPYAVLLYMFLLVSGISGCSFGFGATPTPPPPPTPIPPPLGKIVFATNVAYGKREIYLMDTDGSNLINLTQHPADDSDPAWSPDGRRIVYVSIRDNRRQLMIMDIETRETYLLKGEHLPKTDGASPRSDSDPVWSPDGQWIAYTSSTLTPVANIYKIRIDGTEETQLTNYRAPDVQPTWSPDGKQIAFSSWRRNDPDETFLSPEEKNIFIMNADGSNVRRLTDDRDTENINPQWSQDGQWIVYTSRREVTNPPGSIMLLIRQNVITQERQEIRRVRNRFMTADLSPDGQWLVFEEWTQNRDFVRIEGDMKLEGSLTLCFVQVTGQNYQCLETLVHSPNGSPP